MTEPWFVEAFRAGYLDVYPHRDVASAREEAAWLVEHGVGGRVLDLGCGYGRHCLALRELGVQAFGIDLSQDLLRRATGLSGRIACADARALPVFDGALDGVVSLFSSFGYLGVEGDRQVLAEVSRVVRTGGFLILDLMNPALVRASLVPRSESRRGEFHVEESRSLKEGGRRVVKEVRVRSADGSARSWREDVRLYEIADLRAVLAGIPYEIRDAWGDFDGSALSESSPRQILRLRRR
jgi:SAM-dependent methyltransferase